MTEVVPRPIGVAQRRLRGPGERIGGPIRVGKRRSQRAGKGVARPIAVVQRGVAAGTRSGRPKLGDRRPLPKHDCAPKHRLSEEKSRRFRGHVRAPMVKLVPLVPPPDLPTGIVSTDRREVKPTRGGCRPAEGRGCPLFAWRRTYGQVQPGAKRKAAAENGSGRGSHVIKGPINRPPGKFDYS